MWAILSDPAQRGNKWDEEAFFETGRTHVAEAMARLESLDVHPARSRALDFGCGLGRLTQALAEHFEKVDGVDIAPSMIEGARHHNRHGDQVEYHLNDRDDLGLFPDCSFDLVLSFIVLQHIENRYKMGYLREFVRIVRPGGVILFTVPSHIAPFSRHGLMYAMIPNRALNVYRRGRYGYDGVIELHAMRRTQVESVIADAGGRVVSAEPDPLAGPAWHSFRYTVVKPDGGEANSP